MFFFLSFFVIWLVVVMCFLSNYLVWWSIFILMTLIFVFLGKEGCSFKSCLNYFVIQESLGLIFLVFCGSAAQLFLVMMKVGVAPFHFWLFSVTDGFMDFLLIWFMTFRKLPFFPVLVCLGSSILLFLLVFGIFLCYTQFFVLKGAKNLFIISSTESFSWVFMIFMLSMSGTFFLFFYYLLLMVFLFPKLGSGETSYISWETLLVFLNVPFSVSFFIKIFSLGQVLFLDSLLFLFVLFVMCFSVFSLSLFLVNMSFRDFMKNEGGLKMIYFVLYFGTLVTLV
uniref:NADH dehydrogenase subunit 2 n=1 Tax=Rhigonema thysanophora TaxID=435730 RepID=X2CTU4_9BILA|nr:NADH dehydrogenase subunit 2 [Rhigonema thysanophora]AGZ90406.1 NADH dehydrogenase subunit 2 [Rhigonema thysanophora]